MTQSQINGLSMHGAWTLEIAYQAGFFDGEGSVYVATRSQNLGGSTPTLLVCISNTNRQIIEAHQIQWGGSISKPRYEGSDTRQPQYQWVLSTRPAEQYLRAIYPFVHIKKAVLDAAFQYFKFRNWPANKKIDYGPGAKRGLNLEYKEGILTACQKIRAANSASAPRNARRKYRPLMSTTEGR